MNRLLKNFAVILLTVLLTLGAAYVATKEDATAPWFQIENEHGTRKITIFDAQDTNWYVFLPSYAEMEQVHVILPRGQKFMLGDVPLTSRMSCGGFAADTPYDLSVDGEFLATLWFCQSRNVATLYIDTASGEMTDIHNDKDHEEYVSMVLYMPDGSVDHREAGSRLKGRGNSTWDQDKRPYLLTLASDADLLDMGRAKKWVLLANAYDETNLNNKLVFDLASRVGFSWSPDCAYVDLYLNGSYNGLYLMTEKVEIHENRVNIDPASGDYLCKVETRDRQLDLLNHFESSAGRIIEVCGSEALSAADMDDVSHQVSAMEQEIQSGDDLREAELLDLDSWIRRYLIDEISGNIDSDLTSSYFYYADGKFSAGPVWDYDMALGNHWRNQEPFAFLAKNAYKRNTNHSVYYDCLYGNESFYQRMVEIYRTEFSPVLEALLLQELDQQIGQISEASRMNSIRWRSMFDRWKERNVGLGLVESSQDLKSWFQRRVQFLNSAWLDGVEYCTVQFETEPGDAYWNISVEKGTCLETKFMNLVDTPWLDQETGERVDF